MCNFRSRTQLITASKKTCCEKKKEKKTSTMNTTEIWRSYLLWYSCSCQNNTLPFFFTLSTHGITPMPVSPDCCFSFKNLNFQNDLLKDFNTWHVPGNTILFILYVYKWIKIYILLIYYTYSCTKVPTKVNVFIK